VGYHLAQLQVGGASALSNAMYILRYFGENFNLLAETERQKMMVGLPGGIGFI
ncbi:uncharacterized protein METZ01_LOCUS169588, partial [marine metagenome]